MNTLQVLTIGKPVSKQYREETLKNHVNYLGTLVNKSLSLAQYSLINKKINEIKDKLTNPNIKIKIIEKDDNITLVFFLAIFLTSSL